MKVMIDIPKEFESDLQDKFNEFFERVKCDIDSSLKSQEVSMCGNYERETAEMFLKAFENATIISGDATNKDTLKVMFPDATFYDDKTIHYGYIYADSDRCIENYMMTYNKDWVNAPYKKDVE